ncbi:MAG: hypothetical protein JW982_00420 [Spirochaetes bacterium]|nr:hypothetical protein [Spirochaetota bacterium]
MIHTTINVNSNTKSKIDKISAELKISRSDLIKKLLFEFSLKFAEVKLNQSIKYQNSNDALVYKAFHIILSDTEYEIFIDTRNFCKLSVSLILSIMIDKLYREKDNSIIDIMNNYSEYQYTIILNTINSNKNWIIQWKT